MGLLVAITRGELLTRLPALKLPLQGDDMAVAEQTILDGLESLVGALDRTTERLETITRRLDERDTRVVHDPRVYALDSPHSWYRDLASVNVPAVDAESAHRSEQAQLRLSEYAIELGHESALGSPEGKRVDRILRSRTRVEDESEHRRAHKAAVAELRTLGTGGGTTASASSQGAAFVAPYFLLTSWAPYRGVQRSFADQCRHFPIPPYGMQAYLPYFSEADKVAKVTEGSAVTEASPKTELEGAKVEDLSGFIPGTAQLVDRAMTGGGSMDAVIFQELKERLDQETDLYALNQAITNGEAVTGAATFKWSTMYEDIAKGREKLTDTAGTRLRPTHFFTTSDFFSFASRQVDPTTEEPIVKPWYQPIEPSQILTADDYDGQAEPKYSRFLNYVMPGGVLWISDDNIPAVGTTTKTQLIVSAPGVAIALLEDEPTTHVYMETYANELRIILMLRNYVAAITRHKAGTATITGEGYKTTQV